MIADSSYIVALVNRGDPDHERVAEVARSIRTAPWLPTPALTEICYVLQSRIGPDAVPVFLARLTGAAFGINLLDPVPDDYARAARLLSQYADTGLDFVDALLVAVAERLGDRTVLTLNRHHFGVVRPSHCESFDLLP